MRSGRENGRDFKIISAYFSKIANRSVLPGNKRCVPPHPLRFGVPNGLDAITVSVIMRLKEELVQLLGPDVVCNDAETLAVHSTDKWFASHLPEAVVFAQSTEQVSQVLAFANARGIPVTPRGGGVGYVGGCVPARGGIALSLARMVTGQSLLRAFMAHSRHFTSRMP